MTQRIVRTYRIPPKLEKALGFVSEELSTERSVLVEEALRLYLPQVTMLPFVLDLLAEEEKVAA